MAGPETYSFAAATDHFGYADPAEALMDDAADDGFADYAAAFPRFLDGRLHRDRRLTGPMRRGAGRLL